MNRMVRGVAALLIAFAFCAAPLLTSGAVAQESTPAAGSLLDSLGLPVLEIGVSEAGISAPESFEAGVVLVKVTNTGTEPVTFALIDAPDGITAEAIAADLVAPVLSEFWLESTTPFVHDVMPGTTTSAAVLLDPGSWTIAGASGGAEDVAGEPIPGAELTVTGERADDAAERIESSATLEYGAYEFVIDGPIPAGPAIVKVTNTHIVPHHAVIFGAGRLYTDEEALAGFTAVMSDASPTADFSISFPPQFVAPGVGGGGTIWIEVNFEAGAYLAVCFVADPGQEVPHVMMGMIESFEVSG